MDHEHHDHTPPPIPFTAADEAALRADDVQAAKKIAGLTTAIFMVGIALYITVLISVIVHAPTYALR